MTSKSKTTTTADTQQPAAPAPTATNGNPQNLYISVMTFNPEGRDIGERIVDMHHFGTRKWLQDHLWWATHNGHATEINVATPAQVDEYLANGVKALAEKFNTAAAEPVAAEAA